MTTRVVDMTVDELRDLIAEVVEEKLAEARRDPDEGLELRPELVAELRESQARVARGERGIPLQEVIARLRQRDRVPADPVQSR
jgi:hypothetical protein